MIIIMYIQRFVLRRTRDERTAKKKKKYKIENPKTHTMKNESNILHAIAICYRTLGDVFVCCNMQHPNIRCKAHRQYHVLMRDRASHLIAYECVSTELKRVIY